MPTKRPANKHQQRTEATRAKLMKAAMRVFARDGFEASRIEDIAAEAGHSRGAFYANFETKEDLFFALLEQQASKRIHDLEALLAKRPVGEDRLTQLRNFYLERAGDKQWVLLTLEFKLFALRHARMRAKIAAAHRRIRASLNYEILTKLLPFKEAAFAPCDRDKAVLEATLSGLVLESAYDPTRISLEEARQALGRIFDLLIGPVA